MKEEIIELYKNFLNSSKKQKFGLIVNDCIILTNNETLFKSIYSQEQIIKNNYISNSPNLTYNVIKFDDLNISTYDFQSLTQNLDIKLAVLISNEDKWTGSNKSSTLMLTTNTHDYKSTLPVILNACINNMIKYSTNLIINARLAQNYSVTDFLKGYNSWYELENAKKEILSFIESNEYEISK